MTVIYLSDESVEEKKFHMNKKIVPRWQKVKKIRWRTWDKMKNKKSMQICLTHSRDTDVRYKKLNHKDTKNFQIQDF